MSSISPTNESPYAAPQGMPASPQYWKFVQNLFHGEPADAWLKMRSFSVPLITQIFCWSMVLFCLLNLFAVASRLIYSGRVEELPIYPIFVPLAMLLALVFTKPRAAGPYFKSTWAYYLIFMTLGYIAFAMHYQPGITIRYLVEIPLKPFLCLFGIPWLVFRTVSPDKLPRFQMILTIATAIGAAICVLQLIVPKLFLYILGAHGRGSGFWENPNAAGMVMINVFTLSFIPNWKNWSLAWILRCLLLAGIVATMSRSALLFLPIAGMFYMFFCGKFKRLVGFGLGMTFFLAGFYIFAVLADNGTIPLDKMLKTRIVSILDIFRGNTDNQELQGSRVSLWTAGIEQIVDEGGVITGLGHSGFNKVHKHNLSVHNDYIQHWGIAGIIGLLSLPFYYGSLIYAAFRCKNLRIRAGIISTVMTFALFGWTGAAYFYTPTTGPVMALIAMWLYYGGMCPSEEQALSVRRMVQKDLLRTIMPSRENRPQPGVV